MGQLGVGKAVTSVPTPTMVVVSCPLTGESFVEAAAGWGHTLARTEAGRLFSWGFNALGSLGLGDTQTRFAPEPVGLFGEEDGNGHGSSSGSGGGRVAVGDKNTDTNTNTAPVNTAKIAKIRAAGNCSGALTTRGALLTWGCGTACRLGHRGRPERGDHVLRPLYVERLAKAEVTDFALCGGGGVALVPLRVLSLEPASGPMEVGCWVTVRGYAFWDSPDIVVRFTPIARGHKPSAARSAVGTYVGCGSGAGDGTGYITCMAPCFAAPEHVHVEVMVIMAMRKAN